MNKINTDSLGCVFQFLDTNDLLQCTKVCGKWNKILNRQYIWYLLHVAKSQSNVLFDEKENWKRKVLTLQRICNKLPSLKGYEFILTCLFSTFLFLILTINAKSLESLLNPMDGFEPTFNDNLNEFLILFLYCIINFGQFTDDNFTCTTLEYRVFMKQWNKSLHHINRRSKGFDLMISKYKLMINLLLIVINFFNIFLSYKINETNFMTLTFHAFPTLLILIFNCIFYIRKREQYVDIALGSKSFLKRGFLQNIYISQKHVCSRNYYSIVRLTLKCMKTNTLLYNYPDGTEATTIYEQKVYAQDIILNNFIKSDGFLLLSQKLYIPEVCIPSSRICQWSFEIETKHDVRNYYVCVQ